MDKQNAHEFLDSYNKIDAQLRQLYGFKPSQSFSDMIRRSAENNSVIRKYESDLIDYARLRNAIVHQSTDGRVIAVPCDEVVAEMRLIERLLCTPPTIGGVMGEVVEVNTEEGTFVLRTGTSDEANCSYMKFDKQAIYQTDAKPEPAEEKKEKEEVPAEQPAESAETPAEPFEETKAEEAPAEEKKDEGEDK